MIFEVETGGRTRVVRLDVAPGGYQAWVDGTAYAVDAARVGGSWSMLLGIERGVRRSYDVSVSAGSSGSLLVGVDGRVVPVVVARDQRSRGARRPAARADAGDAGSGPRKPHGVVAPMPGRIVRILVKPGDVVAPRQGLVVVEAMKMENELRSPGAGTVSEVRVTEGALVDANALLVVVD